MSSIKVWIEKMYMLGKGNIFMSMKIAILDKMYMSLLQTNSQKLSIQETNFSIITIIFTYNYLKKINFISLWFNWIKKQFNYLS